MAPTGKAYNVDWILSNNSNVHVANHRDWFTSFTPFTASLSGGLKVEGIGEVVLPVKTSRVKTGAASQGTLVLHDVCFAPSTVCNILGGPIFDKYQVRFGKDTGGLIHPDTGASVAILDAVKLSRLRLRGQSSTQTSLDRDTEYYINARMPESELARWEAHKREALEKSVCKEYTDEEKRWLKVNWKDEFHFLQAYELSIYKEEDRAEGRRIVRAMMQGDGDENGSVSPQLPGLETVVGTNTQGADENDEVSEDESDGVAESDPDDFLRELERDPTSHAADYHFSEKELKWMKKHYKNATNFLYSYGLKFYDDDDCREGKAILQGLMAD